MKSYVSYLRVSTEKQGRSGLGLEAQREAVAQYIRGGDWKLIQEYVEVESGKERERPELSEAMALCKATGATLVVAKIDRLTRDAAFLLSLRDSGVDFVAADMPDANRLTVGIMALIAEQEREAISKRTKAALAAAKARGQQLGAYAKDDKTKFVGRIGTSEDAATARQARTEKYRTIAVQKALLLSRYDPAQQLSLRAIAERFNQDGVSTVSGRGVWSANSVRRLKFLSLG